MKGILLKDLYIAKSGIIVTLTALFVLAFGLSFLLDASSILMLAPAISTVAVYMSITNDASSKWNKNVITMPVSRDQIIGAKYILYLLLSAIPVSTLLGETVIETEVDGLKAISEKLEVINLQLAQRKATGRKIVRWLLISLCAIIVMIFAALIIWSSPYLGWDYSDPETAVLGVAFHSFEWLFVRVAPIIFIVAIIGIFFTFKRK